MVINAKNAFGFETFDQTETKIYFKGSMASFGFIWKQQCTKHC